MIESTLHYIRQMCAKWIACRQIENENRVEECLHIVDVSILNWVGAQHSCFKKIFQ